MLCFVDFVVELLKNVSGKIVCKFVCELYWCGVMCCVN